MKRQSAEEYTKERARVLETPEEKIKRLMQEALGIADANDIPFLATTDEGITASGKAENILKLAMIAAANVAIEVGAPMEEFERVVTMLIRPVYEATKESEDLQETIWDIN